VAHPITAVSGPTLTTLLPRDINNQMVSVEEQGGPHIDDIVAPTCSLGSAIVNPDYLDTLNHCRCARQLPGRVLIVAIRRISLNTITVTFRALTRERAVRSPSCSNRAWGIRRGCSGQVSDPPNRATARVGAREPGAQPAGGDHPCSAKSADPAAGGR